MHSPSRGERGITSEPTPPQAEPWRTRLQRNISRWRGLILFIAGIVAALSALLLYGFFFPGPRPLTSQDINNAVAEVLAGATPAPATSSLVYQTVRPSLVLIETTRPNDEGGLGSGVVVTLEGDILTSLHVVANAETITLTFADGTQSAGQIVAEQPENDIAVVRADQLPTVLVPATLGNPGALHVGDEAYVVGNPFGLYSSMSAGVISGFDRTFQPETSSRRIEGLIQIDAAVNPGNSGGPLLNRYGQVVGIVTGIVNPTEQEVFIGIGFAVPINVAGGAAGLPPY
ncbi:MAG: S1C family serine protease [Anaerolineales bacterium]